jgi:SNF2 family DNA or RNA helicase
MGNQLPIRSPSQDWKTTKTADVKKPTARRLLADLLDENADNEPLVDMVVFDEAHYMRNRESSAYTLGELVRDTTDYLVLLSATPINLKNDDLFNLLKLTDPEHFRYPPRFRANARGQSPSGSGSRSSTKSLGQRKRYRCMP